MNKFVPLKTYVGNWLFEDPKISDDDYNLIKPMSKEYSKKLWIENITSYSCLNQKYIVKEYKNEWTDYLSVAEYNWMNDWNKEDIINFGKNIDNLINLNKSDIIWFFYASEDGFELTFDVFKRNWLNFLFYDDRPILFSPRTKQALIFDSAGALFYGTKLK